MDPLRWPCPMHCVWIALKRNVFLETSLHAATSIYNDHVPECERRQPKLRVVFRSFQKKRGDIEGTKNT